MERSDVPVVAEQPFETPIKQSSRARDWEETVEQPNAAGVDIGAREIFVAVPHDPEGEPVRKFATFTEDLRRLGDWLQRCGVTTVAMESTGVFWIPLYEIIGATWAESLCGERSSPEECPRTADRLA
jgi:hypothetical protein